MDLGDVGGAQTYLRPRAADSDGLEVGMMPTGQRGDIRDEGMDHRIGKEQRLSSSFDTERGPVRLV